MAGFSGIQWWWRWNYSDSGKQQLTAPQWKTQQMKGALTHWTAGLPPALQVLWEVTAQPGMLGPGCLRLGKAVGSLLPMERADVRCVSLGHLLCLSWALSPHLSLWKPRAAWKLCAEDSRVPISLDPWRSAGTPAPTLLAGLSVIRKQNCVVLSYRDSGLAC